MKNSGGRRTSVRSGVAWLAAAVVLACPLASSPCTAAARGEAPEERGEGAREFDRLRQRHFRTLAAIRSETSALEQRIGLLRRLIPADFDAADVERRLRSFAEIEALREVRTRMAGVEAISMASGRPSPYEWHRLQVSGRGFYAGVGVFFDRIGRLPRLVELESLSLEAEPEGLVRFEARLGFAALAGGAQAQATPEHAAGTFPPSSPPQNEPATRERAIEEQRKAMLRVEEQARALLRQLQEEILTVARLKSAGSPSRFHDALARFEDGSRDLTVALQRARFGERLRIEGVLVGAAARSGLRAAFEAAGFEVDALDLAAAGDCHTFSLAARLRHGADDDALDTAAIDPGSGRFEARAAADCAAPPPPPIGQLVARGTSGPLSVRARDLDVADLFRLLAALSGESFVVDGNLEGRLDVDLERVGLEEALTASGAAGIVTGAGPLRRVCRAGCQPQTFPASAESGVSLSFRSAELLDVLRLLQEVSGREVFTPPTVDGRVTVFAREIPWDLALRGIAASAGMAVLVQDARLLVWPSLGPGSPWPPNAVPVSQAQASPGGSTWGRMLDIARLAPEDLRLVGSAHTPRGDLSLAYGPGRVLWILEPGTLLLGSRVERVGPDGPTFVPR